ncbi:MAG: hydrolase [Halioglobus sp.]|nr:hydrolase [Halioglobus sp.]
MRLRENSFAGAGGARIHTRCWQPEAAPRGVLLVSHGAAEHGGRYAGFAAHFTARGYAVAALDHFGHGRSEGGRCCLRSMDDHVRNLETFRAGLQADFPGLPMALVGHSMGGLIACLHLLEKPDLFATAILSGPAIMTALAPPWYQLQLIRLLAVLAPNLGVVQLDADGVSRVPAEVQRYVGDPLNYSGKLSARLVSEMFRSMAIVQARAGDIRLPLLLLHGGADSMTSPAGSEYLYRHAGSAQKALKVYPGAYHEIFNEPEREEVFAQIERWLRDTLGPDGDGG